MGSGHEVEEKNFFGVTSPIRKTGLAHAAHLAWNALARLELMLRGEEHGQ